MKNKILINVYILCLAEEYEMYIPTNESVKEVINLIVKSVYELSDGRLKNDENFCLLDCDSNVAYSYSSIIRDTNIVNGKKIVLV